MPSYTCSNADCSTAGTSFALTSPGQTRCPHCYTANALTAVPTPVIAPISRTRQVATSNAMDATGGDEDDIAEALISKWELNIVSDTEAKKVKDYVYTHEKNANRIDREGPVRGTGQAVTHARYRLQVGKKTLAGIHMQVDTVLDPATIRRAWRESLAAGRYIEVYLGLA
ncbi:MAG: hypothetical protein ABI564_04370 [Ideonella sp.]